MSTTLAAAVVATTVRLVASHAYADGAPPGFSGGFKEDSCHACHFDAEPNSGPGRVTIEGVPATFAPGERYALTITLSRAGMKLAGFQLAARFKDSGAQAGTIAPGPGDAERVGVETQAGVHYASQKKLGAPVGAADAAKWTLTWTAPESGGPVIFHVSANAADGNESADGDFVYTSTAQSAPPPQSDYLCLPETPYVLRRLRLPAFSDSLKSWCPSNQPFDERMRERHVRHRLDFSHVEDPRIRLPLVAAIQRIMVRAEVFRRGVALRRSIKHPTQFHAIHDAAVHAKAHDATCLLVHHDEHPVCTQDGRFAAKQIETPQTVLRVTGDREPGRPRRVWCRTVPNGENAPNHILIDGKSEGQLDLLRDSRTPPGRISSFHPTTAATTS